MPQPTGEKIFKHRQHAAQLLAAKLSQYAGADCLIVSSSKGGVQLGHYLSEELHVPLEIALCNDIRHPSRRHKTIGSICGNEVHTHDVPPDLPQNLVDHKIHMQQEKQNRQHAEVYESLSLPEFKDKTILLTNDWVNSSDELISAIHFIERQKPKKIVVAVPCISGEAVSTIAEQIDDLVFLHLIIETTQPNEFYDFFPIVTMTDIKKYLSKSKGTK